MPLAYSNFFEQMRNQQDKRAILLERMLQGANPTAKSGLLSTGDPYSANSGHKVALEREPHIVFGRIVETQAYTRFIKVQLDRGGGIIACCPLAHNSFGIWGTRSVSNYVPGTGVWVLLPPHGNHGFIIGAAPDWMASASDAISDMLAQGGNVGLKIDEVHNFPFTLNNQGGIIDWSAGGLFDDLPVGADGAITDTGLLSFIDSTMICLRVDEQTGLFLFYADQLTRLSGHNLELVSSGSEQVEHDDNQEYDFVAGYTPYLFEAMGSWDQETETSQELSSEEQQSEPWYSRFEAADDDQQGIYRFRIFRGYLGQAEHQMTMVPPEDSFGLETYSNETKYPGVAETFTALDGKILIRSAKSIVIAKRALMPQPKRTHLDEDVNGATPDNYKAAGLYNSPDADPVPPDHKLTDFEDPPDNANLVRVAAYIDFYTKLANWDGLHPFHYKSDDWFIPDESDFDEAADMLEGIPTFSDLRNDHHLSVPTPITRTVDHRYGVVNYYPNNSEIALLDDGGLIFADGYGSAICSTGGHIYISCPGDIHFLPGRDLHAWVGRNADLIANDSVDISANWKDVRIKAEEKVMIVGGNNECGGVLIESLSLKPAFDAIAGEDQESFDEVIGGILLRARHSIVATYSPIIYNLLPDDGENGVIVHNAKKQGLILSHGKDNIRHVMQSCQDIFWEITNHVITDSEATPASPDGSGYNGPDGSYVITCVQSSTGGDPATARLSITGLDTDPDLVPAPFGEPTSIGNRGFKVTFSSGFVAGQVWSYTINVDKTACVNEYWKDINLLCGALVVDGKTFIADCLSVNGKIATNDTVAATDYTKITTEGKNSIKKMLDTMHDREMYTQNTFAPASRLDCFSTEAESELTKVEFFYRSSDQDGIETFVIFETKWQQAARLSSDSVDGWNMNVITGEDAFPNVSSSHPPGLEAWFEDESYFKQDLTLFNLDDNLMEDRGAVYETPMYDTPTSVTLESNFTVIENPT